MSSDKFISKKPTILFDTYHNITPLTHEVVDVIFDYWCKNVNRKYQERSALEWRALGYVEPYYNVIINSQLKWCPYCYGKLRRVVKKYKYLPCIATEITIDCKYCEDGIYSGHYKRGHRHVQLLERASFPNIKILKQFAQTSDIDLHKVVCSLLTRRCCEYLGGEILAKYKELYQSETKKYNIEVGRLVRENALYEDS
jgi:hypothetical protein